MGATLSGDGFCDNESNKRLGLAKADFNNLVRIWLHSSLNQRRELELFAALIESRLFYALASVCMTVAQEKRLNGFQSYFEDTPVIYISRVSNAAVLNLAHKRPASEVLQERRLILLGKILRSPANSPLRLPTLAGDTTTAATDVFVRRVDRPRKEWYKEVRNIALQRLGSWSQVLDLVVDERAWKAAIKFSFL